MHIDLTLCIDIDDPVIGKASKDPNSYMSRGHIGTHLDVYNGQANPPAGYCERRGLVIDASKMRDADIGQEVLESHELHEGDFVIFYTGQLQRFVYGTKDYFKDHPQLTWEFVNYLAHQKLSFVGLDFAGLRRGDEHGPADAIFADHDSYVIENLDNVDQLLEAAGPRPFKLLTGWTGFKGATGLSCRVIAMVD
jgi:kynurenine formamidase